MKRLYLIRHAKSRKDTPGLKDKDRPLSQRGKRDCLSIGRRLKAKKIKPQAFFSSPAKRALDTARAIANKVGFPRKKIKVVNALYRSNIPKIMKAIKNIDDSVESAAIFGHNPEFFNLANYLSPRLINKCPTCGVFGIAFGVDSWKMLRRKKGRIFFKEKP
jgi:phosphohistidine phosphatase